MKYLILTLTLLCTTSVQASEDPSKTNQYCYAASILLRAPQEDVVRFKQGMMNEIASTGKYSTKDPLELSGFFLGMQLSILQSEIKYGYNSEGNIRKEYKLYCDKEI